MDCIIAHFDRPAAFESHMHITTSQSLLPLKVDFSYVNLIIVDLSTDVNKTLLQGKLQSPVGAKRLIIIFELRSLIKCH